ncbi:hypothetical protein CLV35_2210 [Motilibacter peucedani]|uniref:Uncharacterized protein n=1 Tax=Motilibacter peucedani TaxID=598650 RepID=A0A420XR11_9ACTN|nr:hypothetical protein CLV35_2210 [Motilibacter peucedani]
MRGQGVVAGCGNDSPVHSLVTIERASVPPDSSVRAFQPGAKLSTVAAMLDGVPAQRRTSTLPNGQRHVELTVPGHDVALSATSSDDVLLEQILSSVHLVDVDSAGCATRLPTPAPWDVRRSGPAVDLAAEGAPSSMAVCAYEQDGIDSSLDATPSPEPTQASTATLSASSVLTGDALTQAVAAIDDAAPGPVPDLSARECLAGPDRAPLLLSAHYPSGGTMDVRIRYSTCTDRWTATPHGTSQVTMAQLAALLGPLHIGYATLGSLPGR